MFSLCLSDKFAYSVQQTSVLKLKIMCGQFLILIELISFYESFRKEHSTMNLKCDGKCFHGSDKEKTRCHMYWQEISQKKFRPLLKRNVRLTDGFRLCS